MRKAFLALLIAAGSFTTLAASVEPAAAWRSYRWYRDYAPLYYGPPVVYVVPPAYAYYPPPVYYRGGCCGEIVGPGPTYYPRRFAYPRGVYAYPPGYWGRRRCCR